ncbi:MAG: MBL fold metallo-hydrolase [Chloroflexi bacterium]|jgi:metallo-beta-lactamase family protein|nr:MBL fold metallo-hydrolase [Chloroflexota bacterium]
MHLHFLGGARTVTGSQYLLETSRARVLVDCGMFQGSPNEAVRNRVPFPFEPGSVDVLLLTHAHLDHCGLIPHLVREGFSGPILATPATIELAGLVLLDSGKLQAEFARREDRWERRDPDRAAAEQRKEEAAFEAAVDLAGEGEDRWPGHDAEPHPDEGEHVPTGVVADPVGGTTGAVGGPRPAGGDVEDELRGQPAAIDVDLDEPLYTEREAQLALRLFRPIPYDEEREVAPGVHVTFLDAGHILGSAIIRLRVVDEPGDPGRVLVFSGDLGRRGTPILRDPTVLTHADYVVVESTYGGREHEPADEAARVLAETVRLVDEAGGVLLVPSFAVGRTQEVVWELDRLLSAGRIPPIRLYLDSPMATKATEIYRRHPDCYDAETARLLAEGETPLDYPGAVVVNSAEQSRALAKARRPYMIVASNGMLTGGRVVGHVRNLIDDPDATLLFVGYQGEGTLGAHLQAGAKTVRIDGAVRHVRCRVRSISGFSAHADESELLDWLRAFVDGRAPGDPRRRAGDPGVPRRVFVVHGDPDAQEALVPKISALGLRAYVPVWREAVDLD